MVAEVGAGAGAALKCPHFSKRKPQEFGYSEFPMGISGIWRRAGSLKDDAM
jgi:hypothetical protein